MRRLTRFVVPLAIATLVLSGLGNAAAQKTTIRFVVINYDAGVKQYWDNLVKKFEAANPSITVNVEMPPVNEVHSRLVSDVGAGNAPDLAQVATGWMTDFAAAGKIKPWTQVYSSAELGRFTQSLLKTGEFDGKLYGLPYLATSRAMFINNDIFKSAGVQPPKTWADFKSIAPALNDPPNHYALALQGTGNEAFAAWYLYFLWSFGGEIYNSQGQLAIDSPAGVQALTYMSNLVNDLKVTEPDVVSTDVPQQMQLFETGKAATTITGPWLIGLMQKEAPNINYSVIPIPKGTDQVTLGVTDSMVMFDTAKEAASKKFVNFFLQDANYLEYIKGRGMLSTIDSVSKDPYFTQNPKLNVFTNLLQTAKFVPLTSDWPRVMDEGTKALQAVYLGRKTPEKALQDAVKAVAAAR